jgi:hypothetical protein
VPCFEPAALSRQCSCTRLGTSPSTRSIMRASNIAPSGPFWAAATPTASSAAARSSALRSSSSRRDPPGSLLRPCGTCARTEIPHHLRRVAVGRRDSLPATRLRLTGASKNAGPRPATQSVCLVAPHPRPGDRTGWLCCH